MYARIDSFARSCAVVSSFNNWSQERQFRKLNEQQKNRDINVVRGGIPKKVGSRCSHSVFLVRSSGVHF